MHAIDAISSTTPRYVKRRVWGFLLRRYEMIFNQTLAGAGGGSSTATHSVTPQVFEGHTAYVYDKDTDAWVTTPIDVAVGEYVLVKIVYDGNEGNSGQAVYIDMIDSSGTHHRSGSSTSGIVSMGVKGKVVTRTFYSTECYGAFAMLDDDVTVRCTGGFN